MYHSNTNYASKAGPEDMILKASIHSKQFGQFICDNDLQVYFKDRVSQGLNNQLFPFLILCSAWQVPCTSVTLQIMHVYSQ